MNQANYFTLPNCMILIIGNPTFVYHVKEQSYFSQSYERHKGQYEVGATD